LPKCKIPVRDRKAIRLSRSRVPSAKKKKRKIEKGENVYQHVYHEFINIDIHLIDIIETRQKRIPFMRRCISRIPFTLFRVRAAV